MKSGPRSTKLNQERASLQKTPRQQHEGSVTLIDGKQLAAVCRIEALWRLHCCALPVCGFGEADRPGSRSSRSTRARRQAHHRFFPYTRSTIAPKTSPREKNCQPDARSQFGRDHERDQSRPDKPSDDHWCADSFNPTTAACAWPSSPRDVPALSVSWTSSDLRGVQPTVPGVRPSRRVSCGPITSPLPRQERTSNDL